MIATTSQYPVQRRARGFTLIEVMVSLVILSIGLLGVAKLVMFSSRSNDSAYLRSQATALAYEILDDMRANRSTALLQGYDNVLAAGATPTNPGFTCAGTGNLCSTPANLALYDVYAWQLRLQSAMPGAAGSVTTVIPAGSTATTATIVVSWNDAVAQSAFGAVADGTLVANQTVTLETLL
jgi:type IV pilus assembly protein PilV